jgi:S1-C subfamily serine protease
MQGDQVMDLALIKIIATQDGRVLPANLNLTAMSVGDSDTVEIGDELSIIGFPNLGGATVTFTKGSVSGFLTDEGWIKTDAEVNPGNSGGAAIDQDGQLVGIPSAAAAETIRLPGKIGLVRPVNLARPLIELTLADGF